MVGETSGGAYGRRSEGSCCRARGKGKQDLRQDSGDEGYTQLWTLDSRIKKSNVSCQHLEKVTLVRLAWLEY